MNLLNIDFIQSAVSGKLLSRHHEIFDGVATDTRKAMKNQLFIALKGDAFDAHEFLSKAVEQGASGLLVHTGDAKLENELTKLAQQVTVLRVADTLLALQQLATAVRRQHRAKVLGIAGSNGKTTSKEFCAALLGSARRVHYSKGSFNNHWGVPFTLLAQPEDCDIAVVEMGMNHQGELARLAQIAEPDVVVCTYVGVEHIEHFGTLEKIAEAESEIYDFAPPAATRIYNLDNSFTRKMHSVAAKKFPLAKVMTFSQHESAQVRLNLQQVTMQSLTVTGNIGGVEGRAEVPVFGKHNLTNLMVAACSGLACGLSPQEIWSALPQCKTNWGRNQLVSTASGALILFDGYNSNPDSMKALVENMSLVKASGKKIGVFAEMRELGDLAASLHQETGEAVGSGALDVIWFYGPHAENFAAGLRTAKFRGEILTSADYDSAVAARLADSLKQGDIALVKGSRGMRLERFVQAARPLDFESKN